MRYALKELSDHRVKPDGGYVQVSSVAIGLLAWGHSKGLISHRAVRVALALYELRMRRRADAWTKKKQGKGEPLPAKYSTKELGLLCGLPQKRAKAALGELLALGFVAEFTAERIGFGSSLEALSLTASQLGEFRSFLSSFTPRKRIPLPRRILRLLVESPAPALIATILGVCIRCVWFRRESGFTYSGRFSTTWASTRFGVCVRSIRSAKSHLMALGWFTSDGLPHRFGDRVTVNPAFSRMLSVPESKPAEAASPGQGSGTNPAGVNPPPGTDSAAPLLMYESSPKEKFKNQRESQEQTGPGFFKTESGQKPEEPSLPPPRLSSIRREDLSSTERLLGERGLFGQAVKAGLLTECEADRLFFVACAERARTTAARSPCGVFNTLINDRRKFVGYVSGEQEDLARRRIRQWQNPVRTGDIPFLVPKLPVNLPPIKELSRDALLLKVLRGKGVRDLESVFPTLRRDHAWDRPRFVLALGELDTPSLATGKCSPVPGAESRPSFS